MDSNDQNTLEVTQWDCYGYIYIYNEMWLMLLKEI